jgi:hypothetical protein
MVLGRVDARGKTNAADTADDPATRRRSMQVYDVSRVEHKGSAVKGAGARYSVCGSFFRLSRR